jgi:ATP-dependent helicase HrpA
MRRERPLLTVELPEELPITARAEDITKAIDAHQVVIIAGATGSGKTTQLPKIALAMGRGRERLIGITQPRRIAATSVAARIAKELDTTVGGAVGYQIRFENRISNSTYVKLMTDGILLAEIQDDRLLRRYDTLIIDEAHERSLTIDFLLGWLKKILPERRDLKVIVSSATIETERFASFFDGAPVIQVEGRTYPVDVLYEPPPEDDELSVAVANAVENVTSLDPRGDVLVFLPGEREIHDATSELEARNLRGTVIQPLYSRLSSADQNRVFADIRERRVVLATNVAETSLTIPGIVYVIDTGTARLSRYDPRSGTTRLQIEAVSQASAEQRKGRCGRVREGICVRLYDEQSFAARPAFTDPEIKRTGLAGVILRMKALRLGDVEEFPFLDPPESRSITEGYRVLEELHALAENRELTPIGHQLARFPADPRLSRMILAGAELGCLEDVLIVTAALGSQDPRERPRDAQQKADELHRRFRDERSDFIALLRLWDFIKDAERKGRSNLRRACRDNLLSYPRVREWSEVHRQLEDVVRELRLKTHRDSRGDENALHRALLTGLLSKIGTWRPENRSYMGAKQTRFALHPSSALAKKPPAWVMAFELVETSQLFARTAAKIDPEWLHGAAPHLVKRSYSDPHWSEKSGRAMVKESSTLFGLTIFRDRSVDYAEIAPDKARLMFLEHALVRGEYKSKGAFQQKNRELLAEVARLRDKARQSGMLASDEALLEFFDRQVPAGVVNGKTFETWREQAEKSNPRTLLLSLEDVLAGEQALAASDYPDTLILHGTKLDLGYRFDPSAEDDGITLTVPLVLVPQLDPGELEWTIPGRHREKIEILLEDLPKALRRELGSIPELSRALASKLKPFSGPMLPALARATSELTGADVREESFRPDTAPAYLRLTLRLIDEGGKVVAVGRDIDQLLKHYGAKARAVLKNTAPSAWEKTRLTSWDFGDLPEFVVRRVSTTEVRSYPALIDKESWVDLVLLESAAEAELASRAGVRRLLMIAARSQIGAIKSRLPNPFSLPKNAPGAKTIVLARIIDTAFGLGDDSLLPRNKGEFERILNAGLPKIHSTFLTFESAIQAVAPVLDKTLYALEDARRLPSGRAAILDIETQLNRLFPADLLEWISLARLSHYPRYLRAAQARLARAVNDPQKDASKQATIAPLWAEFLKKRTNARDRAAVTELWWLFEELRVAVFAPELKTPVPVSPSKMSTSLAALR